MSTEAPGSRLSAQDWIAAALREIAEHGVSGVAVEPLATSLGATKGSFYWHFRNRQALVEAALAWWENWGTNEVIAQIDTIADPAERLRALIGLVVEYSRRDRIELGLLSSAGDPAVEPVLARVTSRRIAYVTSIFRDLGFTEQTAQRRAATAVSVYLGHVQLARTAPSRLPQTPETWQAHVHDIVTMLVSGPIPGLDSGSAAEPDSGPDADEPDDA